MFSDKIERLMNERPIPVERVLEELTNSAQARAPEDLDIVVHLTKMSSLFDEIIAIPAVSILPAWGKRGLRELKQIIQHGFHSSDAQRLILTIAAGENPSEARLIGIPEDWYDKCSIAITDDLIEESQLIIRELMLEQNTDQRLRATLITNLSMDLTLFSKRKKDHTTVEYFLSAFTDTRLLLNKQLIDEFEYILNRIAKREEDLHKFLFENPIFLDPLAIEIRSKHELGSEFKTDFVLRRLNDEYVLVEVEKSTDKIFTQKGVFHSNLTEAVGQVRDFQAWIHDNIAYARNFLPGIRRPEGLVIIGRRNDLDETMVSRLDEENYSRRGHIKIITYDDLVEQARIIYSNLLSQPTRYKGKKAITSPEGEADR
jgi:hypothetical protein